MEAQQAEAMQKPSSQRAMSPKEAERWREKESIRLARQRVKQLLSSTENPRHRALLESELAALEQKLQKLEA